MILSTYFAVPVIGGGLFELLSQLEGDLCVFEGALGADHHLVSLLADDHSRLGDISNLTGGKANT